MDGADGTGTTARVARRAPAGEPTRGRIATVSLRFYRVRPGRVKGGPRSLPCRSTSARVLPCCGSLRIRWASGRGPRTGSAFSAAISAFRRKDERFLALELSRGSAAQLAAGTFAAEAAALRAVVLVVAGRQAAGAHDEAGVGRAAGGAFGRPHGVTRARLRAIR